MRQLIAIAKDKGISAYIDEGLNRWAAVHVLTLPFCTSLYLKREWLDAGIML